MSKVLLPRKMREWTLWAAWWFVVGTAVFWQLVGSVAYFVTRGWLPADAAGWAQAAGAVLAIVAAGLFPIWHQARLRNESLALTDDLLAAAALFLRNDLNTLIDAVLGDIHASKDLKSEIFRIRHPVLGRLVSTPSAALVDAARTWSEKYVANGHPAKWQAHTILLDKIASGHLRSREHIVHLSHLLNGAAAANEVCKLLPSWDLSNPACMKLAKRLIYCHTQAVQAVFYLEERAGS